MLPILRKPMCTCRLNTLVRTGGDALRRNIDWSQLFSQPRNTCSPSLTRWWGIVCRSGQCFFRPRKPSLVSMRASTSRPPWTHAMHMC